MTKKLLFYLICFVSITHISKAQSVGIGTTSPSGNAILDVTSTNKGIMLPRINDTTNVTGPSAGLLIFNKNTKSLNFYDGGKWQNLSMATLANAAVADSLVYQTNITTGPVSFYNQPLKTSSLQYKSDILVTLGGGGGVGKVSLSDITFTTELDNNYIPFLRANHAGTVLAEMEFKSYKPGTITLKYTMKLTNFYVTSVTTSIGGGGQFYVTYTLIPGRIAYRDLQNNRLFAYDQVMNSFSTTY